MAEEMELAHVKAAASGVIPAPIDTVWSLVRVFSSIGQWLLQDGFMSLHSELMPGHLEGQIGCCRINTLDGQSFVEALEGLDDVRHRLRYKVVSHPDAVNPFPFAFLNFRSQFQLRKVTLTNETFMEWEGSFDTELPGVEEMQQTITAQFIGGIRGLQKTYARPPSIGHVASRPASNKPIIGATAPSTGYRGQADFGPAAYGAFGGGFANLHPQQQYPPPMSGVETQVPGRAQYSQQLPGQQLPGQLPGQQPHSGNMSQRGSAGNLQDYPPTGFTTGGREQGYPKDSGGSGYSTRSEAAREPTSPHMAAQMAAQAAASQSLRHSGRTGRARRNSGYSST